MDKVLRLLRYAWASPATVVGLAVAALALCLGASARRIDGTFEVAGGRLLGGARRLPPRARFVAMTLGHVIVGVDHAALSCARSHEHVHVRQYERYGVLLFPLYVGASIVALLRGRRPYRDNVFEREAYAHDS